MKSIGVDIDNILSATSHNVLPLIQNYDPAFSMDKWTSFNLYDCSGITRDQQKDVFNTFHENNLESLDTVSNADESLRLLFNRNPIHLITNRPTQYELQTRRWLHKKQIPFTELSFCRDKTEFSDSLDCLIDGGGDHALAMADSGVKVILFDYPWNRHLRAHPLIQRVSGWKHALSLFTRETILEEAQRLVHGPRQASYSHPSDDYARTGRMWGATLSGWLQKPFPDIPPRIACLMMAQVKISRESYKPLRDSRVDLAGYAACADMCAQKENQ